MTLEAIRRMIEMAPEKEKRQFRAQYTYTLNTIRLQAEAARRQEQGEAHENRNDT